jgi:pyruvate/2-oxoacid:ferredoxin oxidoreductase beta subunit
MKLNVYPEFKHTDPSTQQRKDFVTDQDVRWCPGCGDYSILAQVQRVMPSLGIPREKYVFVSGIGCSSRRAQHSRPRARDRDRHQGGAPGPASLGGHGRR